MRRSTPTPRDRSTLLDLDIAQEMTRMVSRKILNDTSTAMISIANQQTGLLLRLVA